MTATTGSWGGGRNSVLNRRKQLMLSPTMFGNYHTVFFFVRGLLNVLGGAFLVPCISAFISFVHIFSLSFN